MKLEFREMRPEDYDQKGYIHFLSWRETYSGLMDDRFIVSQTLEKCQSIAHRWPQNTLLAVLDEKIVGFGCYALQEDGSGEVIAIYLLKEAQGLGIGRKLMDALFAQLKNCTPITLWVLKGNDHAIGFYEHYGFYLDGTTKDSAIGTELRMSFR